MSRLSLVSLAVLAALTVTPAMAQPRPRPAPSDLPVTRAGAVELLARELEQNYTIPEFGEAYAVALRAHLAKGDYEAAATPAALAAQLTADLQAVHSDKHIRVALDDGPGGPGGAPGGPGGGPGGPGGPARAPLKGVEETRWIEPGIAYIRFDLFSGSPEEVAAVKAFMAAHATAKAIIIDARGHHGGGLAEMNVMLPYLYAKKTVLVDMDVSAAVAAREGDPLADEGLVTIKGPPGILRREHVVTPHPTEHRLFKAKVYYLTSTRTGSAAEHLALAFKRTHRATLVGEHTAGANHFGGDEPLGLGLVAFIPVGRTFDPDTGRDWEGVGILPDVDTPADQALDVAVKLAKS